MVSLPGDSVFPSTSGDGVPAWRFCFPPLPQVMVSLPGDSGDPGWLRTGDIATIDTNGVLQLVDRKKDIIIRGGENISCSEVCCG